MKNKPKHTFLLLTIMADVHNRNPRNHQKNSLLFASFQFFRMNAHKLCLMWLKRYSLKYPQLLRKNVNLRNQRFCNISALNISHLGSNGYEGFREKANFVSANPVRVMSVVSNKNNNVEQ